MAKVDRTPIDGDKLEHGVGLALSGGGYRAMLFHAGAIFRMNDLGLLPRLSRVSSVSGGSITAAALALAWKRLEFDAAGRARNLDALFLRPLLQQAQDSMDVTAATLGLLPFVSPADVAARSYSVNITGEATLADLPASPDFVFNATNLMTGVTMRFQREYVADYHIGQIFGLESLRLAEVVAASAAFPPLLSPKVISLVGGRLGPKPGDLARPPYTERAELTDGGVYDNLGSETVWKRYRTLFVSNAGKPFGFEEAPERNWVQQSMRVIDIAMDQAEDLRERILVHAYLTGARQGAMWGLTAGLNRPKDRPPLLNHEEFLAAQAVPTRLTNFGEAVQALLLKAGYAHATARLRKYYNASLGGLAHQPDGHWPVP